MSDRVDIHSGPSQVADAARDRVVHAAERAIAARGVFHWALAGGSTPKAAYASLAALPPGVIDWARVRVWFGDERCVPPDHAESNFRMAADSLLSRVPIPPSNIHHIQAELGPAAAPGYESLLAATFTRAAPSFDLVLLGLGTDGHTASLFSAADFPPDPARLAISVVAPPGYSIRPRISLTHHVLARARGVVFLVTGLEKRDILARVLQPSSDQDRALPASIIASTCHTFWIVDRDAIGN
ncbi:MAG: 6-phosphogluconolactonase [Phycisphaerales bacterium]|jgi:6-phosphogluconolactonase|nr:6-phosphogluconolactonase [Phycisphaerales bacterium]